MKHTTGIMSEKLMKEQLKGRSGSRVEGLLIWIFAVGKGVWGRGGGGREEGRGVGRARLSSSC